MRNGRLADLAASREVAGADRALAGQLAEDGQPGGIGCSMEQRDVRILQGDAPMGPSVGRRSYLAR